MPSHYLAFKKVVLRVSRIQHMLPLRSRFLGRPLRGVPALE